VTENATIIGVPFDRDSATHPAVRGLAPPHLAPAPRFLRPPPVFEAIRPPSFDAVEACHVRPSDTSHGSRPWARTSTIRPGTAPGRRDHMRTVPDRRSRRVAAEWSRDTGLVRCGHGLPHVSRGGRRPVPVEEREGVSPRYGRQRGRADAVKGRDSSRPGIRSPRDTNSVDEA
jgi:hypothetical protein